MARLSLHVDDAGRTALLRSGWSWLAALALPLWALHRQLWKTVLPLTVAVLLLHALVGVALEAAGDDTTAGLIALAWLAAWSVACGVLANRAHAWLLGRAGYRMVAAERGR